VGVECTYAQRIVPRALLVGRTESEGVRPVPGTVGTKDKRGRVIAHRSGRFPHAGTPPWIDGHAIHPMAPAGAPANAPKTYVCRAKPA
jgi:hypothetical protein